MSGVEVVELTYEEGRAMLNEATQAELGISAYQFLERYDRGDYAGVDCDHPAVRLEMFISYVRPVPSDRSRR